MRFVADTVALIRFLTGNKKIGKSALKLMMDANEGKGEIIVSTMSLMEIMYSIEKGRIELDLYDLIDTLGKHENFTIYNMTQDIVKSARDIQGLELHDRMIIATSKYLACPLLTCDTQISTNKDIDIIW